MFNCTYFFIDIHFVDTLQNSLTETISMSTYNMGSKGAMPNIVIEILANTQLFMFSEMFVLSAISYSKSIFSCHLYCYSCTVVP